MTNLDSILKSRDPWVRVRGQREGWETSGPTGVYEPGWKPPWSGRASERAPVWGAAWGSGQSPRHSEPQVGTGGTGTQVLGDNGVERKSSSSSLSGEVAPSTPLLSPCAALPPQTPFLQRVKRLFSSSSPSAIRVVSGAYLRLLIFSPAILIPACDSSMNFISLVSTYSARDCAAWTSPRLPVLPSVPSSEATRCVRPGVCGPSASLCSQPLGVSPSRCARHIEGASP